MPHLIVEDWHGKILCAIHFGEENETDKKRKPRPKRIPITEDEASLGLAALKQLYKKQIAAAFETKSDVLLAQAAEKTEKLKKTLEGIIKTSNQDGEVQSAKAAWKRITGNDYA